MPTYQLTDFGEGAQVTHATEREGRARFGRVAWEAIKRNLLPWLHCSRIDN